MKHSFQPHTLKLYPATVRCASVIPKPGKERVVCLSVLRCSYSWRCCSFRTEEASQTSLIQKQTKTCPSCGRDECRERERESINPTWSHCAANLCSIFPWHHQRWPHVNDGCNEISI